MITVLIILAAAIAVNYLLCTIFQKEIGIPEAAVYNPILAFINGVWLNVEKYVIGHATRLFSIALFVFGVWLFGKEGIKVIWPVIIILIAGGLVDVFGAYIEKLVKKI
jgi:hypothetical protein